MHLDETQRRPGTMRLSDFTTVELQRVARAILRRYLELEGGSGPAVGLVPFLAPVAVVSLQGLLTNRARRTLRHADLGPVAVLRLGPDRAYATAALTSPGEGAPSVLSVELEVRDQRLAAVRVGEAASRAPSRQEFAEIPWVGPGQPIPDAPAQLAGLLGGVPTDPPALDRWVTAAAVIDTYRERYGIDDASSAFGSTPVNREQRDERERALAYVREVAKDVETIQPQSERVPGRDRPAGPELGP